MIFITPKTIKQTCGDDEEDRGRGDDIQEERDHGREPS